MHMLPSTDLLVLAGVNVILAWSFFIILSTGQISLGNAAFMAIGAYTSSVVTVKLGWPLLAGMALATVVSGIFGALVGFPALRLRGIYLALVTIGLNEVVTVFFKNFTYTGAAVGFRGMTGTTIGVVLAALVVLALFLWRLSHSRLGIAFEAVKEDEVVAGTLGFNVTYLKVLSFGIGGAVAALAGAIYAHYIFFIEPDQFGVMASFQPALFVILGGMETFWGAVAGAVILTFIPEYIRVLQEWRMVVYGVIVIIMVAIRPQGLISRSAVRRLGSTLTGYASKLRVTKVR